MKIILLTALALLVCTHAAILPFNTPSATGTAGPTGSESSSATGSITGSISSTGTGATGLSPSATGTGVETGSTGSSFSATGTAQPTGTGSGSESGEGSTGSSGGAENPPPATNTSNAAWLWAQETLRVLDAVKNSNSPKAAFFSPPIAARVLAIVDTAMYDAASAYLPNTTSWSNFTALKLEGSDADLNQAVSHAAYRALLSLFAPFADQLTNTTQLFQSLGYSPSDNSTLPASQSPSAVGNSAAYAVLKKRSDDGTNQNGDADGTPSGWVGIPYADYTNYFPVNDAQSAYARTSCEELRDVGHWQPLRVLKPNQFFGPNITSDQFAANRSGTVSGPQCCVDRNGSAPFQKAAFSRTAIQSWLSPFMAFVAPFADWNTASLLHSLHANLSHPAVLGALDSTGRALSESNFDELLAAVVERMSSNLNASTKGWVDLWTNGINNSFAPSHWRHLALIIVADKNMTVHDTVKLLFAHSNAMFDTGVAVWTLKRTFDTARPISAIQCRLANSTLSGYRGPYLGSGSVNGSAFMPYSPAYALSPAYGEYPSGSSAFAAASVRVLAYFLNDTALNVTIVLPSGTSSVEPRITDASNRYYRENLTDTPANSTDDQGYAIPSDQTLSYTSLSDLQDQAMLAPLYAGLAFPNSVADGRLIGSAVADRVLLKYTDLTSHGPAASSAPPSDSESSESSAGLPSNT